MDINNDCDEPNLTSLEYAVKRSLLSRNKLVLIIKNPDEIVQFTCVECAYKCDVKELMERHLLKHNKEYRFLCGICGTGLKRREHLERHTLEHQEVRPHVCPVCGKAFKRKEHMNIHLTIHTGDKSELCPVCHKSFYRKDHLRKHLQTHGRNYLEHGMHPLYDHVFVEIKQEMVDEDEKPKIEPEDTREDDQEMTEEINEEINRNEMNEQQDSSSQDTNNSVTSKATKNERPFSCVLCHKSYKRRDHLKIHSWTHVKKDKVCSECGKAFHREEQLLVHMNSHLESYQPGVKREPKRVQQVEDDPYDSDNLPLVSRSKKQKESRPHECAVCSRRFKRKQHLKQHLNVHFKINQPSIWCSICGEGFLSNRRFELHQCISTSKDNGEDYEGNQTSTPMEAKKENKYPQEFMDVSELIPLEEGEQYIEEHDLPMPQRVFVCKYCTKPFKRKDHYKIHLNIHTGVKTFFCPTCGKGFYRKDHMQKHTQIHLRDRDIKPAIEKVKPKREIPELFPIKAITSSLKPEITIHAPASSKLRVPLQMKVPYQMVVSLDNGEQRAVTVDPRTDHHAS